MGKPIWWVKPLTNKDEIHHGCLNCGGTEITLDLETRLYSGFGGWMVTVNGDLFYMQEQGKEYDEAKQLKDIETEAKERPNNDWRAEMDLPLRGGSYQRYRGKWYLIESNQGFA